MEGTNGACEPVSQIDQRLVRLVQTFKRPPHIRVVDLIDVHAAVRLIDKEVKLPRNIRPFKSGR